MAGIKLKFNDKGDADIAPEECLVECKYAQKDWICGYTGERVWDYWRNPGWCPLFKWCRTSKCEELYGKRNAGTQRNNHGSENQEQNENNTEELSET